MGGQRPVEGPSIASGGGPDDVPLGRLHLQHQARAVGRDVADGQGGRPPRPHSARDFNDGVVVERPQGAAIADAQDLRRRSIERDRRHQVDGDLFVAA